MSERMEDTAHEETTSEETLLTPEEREAARRRSRTRGVTLMVLAVVIVAAAAAVVIANVGEPNDPTRVPTGWEAPDLDAAETIDLGDGPYSAIVVINANEQTCWNGYVVDQQLDECGPKTYRVEGADKTIGINAKTEEVTRSFIGVAVWDADVTRVIETAQTRKKFGVVAVTAAVGLQ